MKNGYTYNGIHSSTYGIKARGRPRIFPVVRRQTMEIPRKHGVYRFDSYLGERTIEIDNVLKQGSQADYRDVIRDVMAWLSPLDGPKQLIFDSEPDKFYWAELNGEIDAEEYVFAGKFTVPMVCSDPFAYAVTETDRTIIGSGTINNEGNQQVSPLLIVTMTGAVSNLTINNNTTGEQLTITGLLSSGTVVEIDGGYQTTKTVKIDGSNGLGQMSGQFLSLAVGSNSLTVSNSNASVRVKFRAKWL